MVVEMMDPAHAHHRRGGGAAGGRDLHGQVEAVIDLVILDEVRRHDDQVEGGDVAGDVRSSASNTIPLMAARAPRLQRSPGGATIT